MTKKHNRKAIALVAGILTLALLAAGATGMVLFQKFMFHERNQSQRLADIEARIGLIEAKDDLAAAVDASAAAAEAIWLGGGGTTI